jgi:hypothetical protein
VVDRPRAELDGERHSPDLRELVAVEPQGEPGRAAGTEVAASLLDVERPALDEDVSGEGDSSRIGQDVRDQPVDVGVRVGVLRRHRVGAEPRGHAACAAHRLELCELRVVIEAVTTLALERRRAVGDHRLPVSLDDLVEGVRAGRAGRPGRGQDPASRGQKLLVRRSRGAEGELVRTVAGERRVRVAVDEPGDGTEPVPVDLVHVAIDRREAGHRTDCLDEPVAYEDERVLDHLDLAEGRAAEHGAWNGRGCELREIADEEPAHGTNVRS